MRWLRQLPIRFPVITLVLMATATLLFAYAARTLRIDSSIENLLPVDDPERLYYDEIRETFGDEEILVIGIFADDVFDPATLAKVQQLTERVAALDGVQEVISLSNIRSAEMTDEGLTIGRVMREIPTTREGIETLRARVMANAHFIGNVLSADSRATSLSVIFEPMTDDEFLRRGLAIDIERLAADLEGPEEFAITGMPVAKAQATLMMESDLLTFTPLSALLVICVLLFAFRTPRGIFVPLSVVVVAVLWTSGLMALTHTPISLGTLVLHPLLMVIAGASGIHLITEYYLEVRPGRSARELVEHALDRVALPVTTCGVTTLIGFGTLIFVPIGGVREFGIFSVFGIATVMLATFTVIPAMLVLLPVSGHAPLADASEGGRLSKALRAITALVLRYRWTALALSVLAVAVSLVGIVKINVETDYLGFFDPDHPIRVQNDRISRELAGTQPIYVIIDGMEAGSVTRLETVRAMRELQAFIRDQPGVDTVLSLVDYLVLMRSVLQPDSKPGLPEAQGELNQLLLLVDRKQISPVLNKENTRANIIVRTSLSRSVEVGELVERVRERADHLLPRGVVARPTGTVVLLSQSADELAWGQITGLWQELLVLFVLLSIMFLSARVGALALIPNVVPTIILFGIMGFSGIDLNICTCMIAAIAIGIAIDDTIHLLSRFNEELHRTGSQEEAILNAVGTVGQAAFLISFSLAAGFLIVCLSNFQPVRHFGLLSGLTMGIALVVELVLTPALVTTTKIATLWDFLFLKLGPEPHKQIPMFKDLWSFQAKLVVLMGGLRSVKKGELIAEVGELTPEMYVVLKGHAEVYRDNPEKILRHINRGDVIGEMGLVRESPRSANVVATEDTEYFVLGVKHLERLHRRYPRIAATVYLNLSRILSDRLETTTDSLAAITARRAAKVAS